MDGDAICELCGLHEGEHHDRYIEWPIGVYFEELMRTVGAHQFQLAHDPIVTEERFRLLHEDGARRFNG